MVEYVQISGSGPNALDFHIAFYIGQFAAQDPTACFHIVSNDTGFDPLIEHLKSRKISAARTPSIDSIPAIKNGGANSPTCTGIYSSIESADVHQAQDHKDALQCHQPLFPETVVGSRNGSGDRILAVFRTHYRQGWKDRLHSVTARAI
jgi:hypothetical protein